jgi:hypothetical protein
LRVLSAGSYNRYPEEPQEKTLIGSDQLNGERERNAAMDWRELHILPKV